MRTLIAFIAAATTAFALLGASAGTANAGQEPSGKMVTCLTGKGGSGAWTIQWIREGGGRCPGQILASDAVTLANMADKGVTSFRVAFYIPEKCPASRWASMPAKANQRTGKIKIFPWRKMCSRSGYFKPYAK